MNYLYEKILATQKIPEAYEVWEEYRTEVTKYLLKRMGTNKKIMILGAGACNDIALSSLLAAGHEVTLADCDEVAMEEGMKRQLKEQNNTKITMQYCNVWDVTVQEYHRLEECLFQKMPMSSVISYMQHICERIQSQPLMPLQEPVDAIVCIGFHSQITVMFISLLQYYMMLYHVGYSKEEVLAYQNAVIKMNEVVTKRVGQFMEQSAKQFIVGYEYASFDACDMRIYEVRDLFLQGKAQEAAKLGLGRVQGALQLEYLLGEQLSKQSIRVKDWQYVIWNFLPEKNYLMILYDGEYMKENGK